MIIRDLSRAENFVNNYKNKRYDLAFDGYDMVFADKKPTSFMGKSVRWIDGAWRETLVIRPGERGYVIPARCVR